MEASDILFWFSVFLALYGGKWITTKARKNNLEGYEEDCERDTSCTIDTKDES